MKAYMFHRPTLTSTNGAENIKQAWIQVQKHVRVCVGIPPQHVCHEGPSAHVYASPAGHY